MDEDCIFCSIVDGSVPSTTVYEADRVRAFLDANPLARGHTLVVPNDHYERVGDMPADTGRAVFDTMRRLAPAVQTAMDADGITLGVNDGTAAGQEIPHVHCHVIPREEGDGAGAIHSLRWPRPDVEDEFEAIAEAISAEYRE